MQTTAHVLRFPSPKVRFLFQTSSSRDTSINQRAFSRKDLKIAVLRQNAQNVSIEIAQQKAVDFGSWIMDSARSLHNPLQLMPVSRQPFGGKAKRRWKKEVFRKFHECRLEEVRSRSSNNSANIWPDYAAARMAFKKNNISDIHRRSTFKCSFACVMHASSSGQPRATLQTCASR